LVIISRLRRTGGASVSQNVKFPWFVVWFGAVIVVQSLVKLPLATRTHLIDFDTVLLSSAMFALNMATRWQQLKQAGTWPLLLASAIFAGLVSGGWVITRLRV